MDCSLPGSSAHGIFLAGILEWVAISLFRESSQPSHQTYISCIDRRILYHWASQEAHFYNYSAQKVKKQTNKQKKNKKNNLEFFLSYIFPLISDSKLSRKQNVFNCQNISRMKPALTTSQFPLLSTMLSVTFAVVSWSVSLFLCLHSYSPLHCVLKKAASVVIL